MSPRLLRGGWLAAALWLAALPALAQERILHYGSDLTVNADGSLNVVETVRVRAEGSQIRRGIYRDFPTRYRDRLGNRVVVDFELLGVERDGRPEPHFTERIANGVRINTGNDDFLPVPAEYTYTLRYRTTRQLGFFPTHDELYWNVNGLGWDFAIESTEARVHLPSAVPADQLRLDGYTGAYGATGKDYQAGVEAPGQVVFRSTRALMPQEGLTVVVGFPKGLVAAPTRADRWRWFLRDNRGVLVALAGLLALVGFYGWRWHRFGRDPQAGPVFPRYEPPADLCPAETRMLLRMAYDTRCFAADVVDMAVRGYLDIHAGSTGSDDWRLEKRAGGRLESLSESQRAIAAKLFASGDTVELKNTEAARVGGARAAQTRALSQRLSPAFFVTNGGSLGLGLLFSIAVGVLAVIVAAGNGIVVLVVVFALMLAAHVMFARLLKAPTPAGRKRMDEIEGLKLYLSVAERDEIQAQPTPSRAPMLDPGRYEQLLPYAMALDVEAAWTKKFTAAVGEAVARETQPGWYHGQPGTAMGLAGMGSSLGSALTQQISSSATPPGSSSGGGGGGFSGGGGGGGGGGGR